MFEQYYNLNERPFQLTPDPDFYFESGTHRKALSYLGYGLAQGEGFIVITGEIGAGKSTLVAHLMKTVDAERLTAVTIVTSQLDGDDLLQMVAHSFGLSVQNGDKAGTLKAIEGFLHDEARAGRRCLLVVDEAQNLSTAALEELRMLSNFQLGKQALLQIFLLGQPEFQNMVQKNPALEQLRQRVIATHHLQGMEADEVSGYLDHRLKRAGSQGRPSFSGDAAKALYNATGGIPRQINTLASRLLLMGAMEQQDIIDDAMVMAVLSDMGQDAHQDEESILDQDSDLQDAETGLENIAKDAGDNIAADAYAASEDPSLSAAETENIGKQHMDFDALADTPLSAVNEMDEDTLEDCAATETFSQTLSVLRTQTNAEQLKVATIGNQSEDVVAGNAPQGAIDNSDYILERVAALEVRITEQEKSMRRILEMLIDWVETEEETARRNAA